MSGVLSKKIECFSHTGVTFRFTPMAETDQVYLLLALLVELPGVFITCLSGHYRGQVGPGHVVWSLDNTCCLYLIIWINGRQLLPISSIL